MIAPLPQSPLPPGDAPGTRANGSETGVDGFAEILAAAGVTAGAAAASRLSMSPSIEHGPARVALKGTPPLGTDVAAVRDTADPASPAGQPVPEEIRPIAEVFNQFGFFASGGAIGGVAETPALPPAPSPSSATAREAGPAQDMRRLGSDSFLRSPIAGGGTFSPEAVTGHGGPPLPVRAAARNVPAIPVAVPVDNDIAAEAPEPATPASRRLPARAPAARVTLQVVLRELEQGIHVAARIDALGVSERETMHDEILALLSRHGLASRGVRITAPPIPLSQERKN